MNLNINKTFFIQNKKTLILISSILVAYLYINPNIPLAPLNATLLLAFCTILIDYIEKKLKKRLHLKNNKQKWFSITKYPISNDSEEVMGIYSVAQNIEAKKQIYKQRKCYAATLNHELKTPTLSQIKALDLLLNETLGPLTQEQRNLIILTKKSCSYMYEMLSTLLYSYKYENGDYALNYELCDLKELIIYICKKSHELLKEKELDIKIIENNNTGLVMCDKNQILQVITNLLNNSIFSSLNNKTIKIILQSTPGNIEVKYETQFGQSNSNFFKNIFKNNRFFNKKYNKIGTELGLYLSKQIIEAHQGEMYTEDYQNGKSIIGFILPTDITFH